MAHVVDKTAVVAQLQAFFDWLQQRWPGSTIRVEANRPDGTRLRGRIDMLLDTPEGWILIDHESNPGGTSQMTRSLKGAAHRYRPMLGPLRNVRAKGAKER